MTDPKLLDKITALEDKYSDAFDADLLRTWYADAKKFLLVESLANHDAIKFLLDRFQNTVTLINQRLLGSMSKELPDRERDLMMIRRDFYQDFVNFFQENAAGVEALEREVENS
jgi:predicted nucleotidyltransferase